MESTSELRLPPAPFVGNEGEKRLQCSFDVYVNMINKSRWQVKWRIPGKRIQDSAVLPTRLSPVLPVGTLLKFAGADPAAVL